LKKKGWEETGQKWKIGEGEEGIKVFFASATKCIILEWSVLGRGGRGSKKPDSILF